MEENKAVSIPPQCITSDGLNNNKVVITKIICEEIKRYLQRHVNNNVGYEIVREHIYYNLTTHDGKGFKEEARASLDVCLVIENARGMKINFDLMNPPKKEEIKKRIELELEYIRTKTHMETLQEKRKAYESGRL